MSNLSTQQKAMIQARLADGVPIRAIAAELGISKNTVLSAKRKITEFEAIVRKQGSGRRNVSTEQEDANLLNFLRENPFETAITAREQVNFPASIYTVRRRIKNSELRNRCAANKIYLTEVNKQQRLEFAQQFVDNVNLWENVVFSDEKSFQSYHDGRLRVYRPRGTRYNDQYVRTVNRAGHFSVNVWGWISGRGPGVCAIIEERLNAQVYCRILNEIMLPSVLPMFGNDFTFQHVSFNNTYFDIIAT